MSRELYIEYDWRTIYVTYQRLPRKRDVEFGYEAFAWGERETVRNVYTMCDKNV